MWDVNGQNSRNSPRNFDGHFQSLVGLLDLTEVAESRRFEAVRVRFIRAKSDEPIRGVRRSVKVSCIEVGRHYKQHPNPHERVMRAQPHRFA